MLMDNILDIIMGIAGFIFSMGFCLIIGVGVRSLIIDSRKLEKQNGFLQSIYSLIVGIAVVLIIAYALRAAGCSKKNNDQDEDEEPIELKTMRR
jgi:cytochrome bd-type quinol oxidase subunit 2